MESKSRSDSMLWSADALVGEGAFGVETRHGMRSVGEMLVGLIDEVTA